MINIIDKNAFYLRITGKTKIGEYETTLDMNVIDSLIVNFVRRGRLSQVVSVDAQNRVLVYNNGTLAKGVYGVELVGYYNGQPWRHFASDVFAIVDSDGENPDSAISNIDVFDVTLYMKLSGDGVTADFVQAMMEEHNADALAHTEIRSEIPAKISDLNNDSGYQTEQQVENTVQNAVLASRINDAGASLVEDGGEPDLVAGLSGQKLVLVGKNLRGPKGDTGEIGPQGPQGPQGDTAVYNPEDPDAPDFVMADTTGMSTTKAMTQKAITDLMTYETKTLVEASSASRYISSNKWTGGGDNSCKFFVVKPGKTYQVTSPGNVQIHVIFMTSDATTGTPAYAGGVTTMPAWTPAGVTRMVAPGDAAFLYCRDRYNGDRLPTVEELTLTNEKMSDMEANVEKIKENNDFYLDKQTLQTGSEETNYISGNEWKTGSASNRCKLVHVKPGNVYIIHALASRRQWHAFFVKNGMKSGIPAYAGDVESMPAWEAGEKVMVAPPDAGRLYIRTKSGGVNVEPVIEAAETLKTYAEEVNRENGNCYWKRIYTGDYENISTWYISDNLWKKYNSGAQSCKLIPIVPGRRYKITNQSGKGNHHAIFLTNNEYVANTMPSYAGGIDMMPDWKTYDEYVVAPLDAKYLYVRGYMGVDVSYTPYIWEEMSTKEAAQGGITQRSILQQSKYTGDTAGTQPLGIMHFSDLHGDNDAVNEIIKHSAIFDDSIDDVLVTGDVVHYYADGTSTYPNDAAWWQASGLPEKTLFVLGNHDGTTSSDTVFWDSKGKEWDFDNYIAPYAEDLGIILPEGYDDPTSEYYKACYWYKDYPEKKIRLIGLDAIHRFDGVMDAETGEITTEGVRKLTNEQELWLIERLNETLVGSGDDAEGYSVIVVAHWALDDFTGDGEGGIVIDHKTNDIVNWHYRTLPALDSDRKYNFRDRVGTTSSWSKGSSNNVGDIIQNFIDNNGKFVAWLCGHYHCDLMFYPDRYPNILNIAVTQTGWLRGGSESYRGDHSPLRAAANIISFDVVNNLIKMVRVGLKVDRFLTPKNVICYDYVNHKVINEW